MRRRANRTWPTKFFPDLFAEVTHATSIASRTGPRNSPRGPDAVLRGVLCSIFSRSQDVTVAALIVPGSYGQQEARILADEYHPVARKLLTNYG